MAYICHGNGADHCCYLAGQVCPFLEEGTVPGRRWACGLLRELGDWNLVHTDPRYLETVRPAWDRVERADGAPMPDCGEWRERQCCFAGG